MWRVILGILISFIWCWGKCEVSLSLLKVTKDMEKKRMSNIEQGILNVEGKKKQPQTRQTARRLRHSSEQYREPTQLKRRRK